jgi:hypothetical protein
MGFGTDHLSKAAFYQNGSRQSSFGRARVTGSKSSQHRPPLKRHFKSDRMRLEQNDYVAFQVGSGGSSQYYSSTTGATLKRRLLRSTQDLRPFRRFQIAGQRFKYPQDAAVLDTCRAPH